MARDARRSSDADNAAALFDGFEEPPRWDWQTWLWLAYWVLGLGLLLYGIFGGLLLEGVTPAWILVGLVLCAGGIFPWNLWRGGRKRAAVLADFAKENGYSFKLALKEKQLKRLPPFPLFQMGEKRRARNVISGEVEGQPFVFMDYTYEADAGPVAQLAGVAGLDLPEESAMPISQTVVAFPRLPRKLPSFRLVPRSLFKKSFDRILEAVQTVDFGKEADKKFTRSYAVEGEPAELLQRVFAPAVQASLAADPRWYVECHDNQMVIFRAGRRCSPELAEERLEKSLDILRVLTRTRPAGKDKGEPV